MLHTSLNIHINNNNNSYLITSVTYLGYIIKTHRFNLSIKFKLLIQLIYCDLCIQRKCFKLHYILFFRFYCVCSEFEKEEVHCSVYLGKLLNISN